MCNIVFIYYASLFFFGLQGENSSYVLTLSQSGQYMTPGVTDDENHMLLSEQVICQEILFVHFMSTSYNPSNDPLNTSLS